jgi:hypothetical protein
MQPRACVAPSASLIAASEAHAPPLAKPLWSHGALVRSLGTVVWDIDAFHSRTMIWPVGFRSTRELRSLNHSGRRALYTSEIMVIGNRPLFRVTASDEPAAPVDAWDPTSAWATMLQRIESRWPGVRLPLRTSGEVQFGLCGATLHRIEALPNAARCARHVPQQQRVAAADRPRIDEAAASDKAAALDQAGTPRAAQSQRRAATKDFSAWSNRSAKLEGRPGILHRVERVGTAATWQFHADDGERRELDVAALALDGKLRIVHRIPPAPLASREAEAAAMEKSTHRWLTEMEAAQRADAALRDAKAARAAPRVRFIVGSDASRSSSPASPPFAGYVDGEGGGEAETDDGEDGEEDAAAAAAATGTRHVTHAASRAEKEVLATARWALQSAARARKRLEGGDAPSSAPAPKRLRLSLSEEMSIRAAALPPVPPSLMDRAIFVLWGAHRLTLTVTLGEEDI